jgi:tetratricopeptide (TPR) repeat protein
VLEALKSLRIPLATTNYDGLIEEVTEWEPVTWRQGSEAERVLRGEAEGVLHLHGFWKDPESVVLGIRSYHAVRSDLHAQAVLRGLRLTRSLLFIGFGAGLADPNFGDLLRWSRETFEGTEYRQFRLARTSEVDTVQRQHPPEERIFVVPIGESHDDLAPFLRGLAVPIEHARHPVPAESPSMAPEEAPRPAEPARIGRATDAPPGGNALEAGLGGRLIWNVPHQRNLNFSGRDTELQGLRDALVSDPDAAPTQGRVAIHGLGGVGKTQLAVEYAYSQDSQYDVVWWVQCDAPATLAADYAALARALSLPEAHVEGQADIKAAQRWLNEGGDRWLLVFDNAGDPEHLTAYLPRADAGHVLITSRNPAWGRLARPVQLRPLGVEAAAAFLMRRSGRETHASDEECSAATDLANDLGGLPLVLEQAAAYVEETGGSLAAYLRLYRRREAELLADDETEPDHQTTVLTTWELAFGRVTETDGAVDLLRLCSYLASEAIPRDVLASHAERLPGSLPTILSDELETDRAIRALRRYSLVEVVDDRTLSVHRMVQAVCRHRLSAEDRRTWAQAAVHLIAAAFPRDSDDLRSWPECARLLNHCLSAVQHAETLGIADATASQLLNHVALYLEGRAQFAEARAVVERALAIDEARGSNRAAVVTDLTNLGTILRRLGDPKEAQKQLERALRIIDEQGAERGLLPQANVLSKLGSILHDLEDFARARQHLERSLSIREAIYGPEHRSIAINLCNLARVLRSLGDLDTAKRHLERALAFFESSKGPHDPSVTIALTNLGLVSLDQGNPIVARDYLERALAIDQAAYGESHPATATGLFNLGRVLAALGDLHGARQYIEQALAIDESAYGSDHPETATDLCTLGEILARLGEVDAAGENFRRAVTIFQAKFGEEHSQTKKARKMLDGLAQ